MALVFYSAGEPRPATIAETPSLPLHGAAYFVMAILAFRALGRGLARRLPWTVLLGGVAIAVAYGVTDEWHQSFVDGRDGEVADVLYDVLGAVAAAATMTAYGYWLAPGPVGEKPEEA